MSQHAPVPLVEVRDNLFGEQTQAAARLVERQSRRRHVVDQVGEGALRIGHGGGCAPTSCEWLIGLQLSVLPFAIGLAAPIAGRLMARYLQATP